LDKDAEADPKLSAEQQAILGEEAESPDGPATIQVRFVGFGEHHWSSGLPQRQDLTQSRFDAKI